MMNMARVPASSAGTEGGEDLDNTGGNRPAGHEQHQDESRRPGPRERDHARGDVDESEDQMPEDWAGGAAPERAHRFEPGPHEGVHGEQDDEGKDRNPRPRESDDADPEREQASPDEGGAE